MALALLKSDDKEGAGGAKHSLKTRLRAWWAGYELRPVESAASGKAASSADSDSAVAETGDFSEWTQSRQQLVQLIWGEGFSGPGGAEHILELAKPFGLTNQNTLLEIGSGLGGSACVVVDELKGYVDGLEFNADLVEHAGAMALINGLEAKAKFRWVKPGELGLKSRYYDGCLLHDTLLAVEDKETLLEDAVLALKLGKMIVIADVFASTAKPGPVATASLAKELGDVFPCGAARIIEILESMDVEIRSDTDETNNRSAMARAAWSGVAARLAGKEIDEQTADILLYETDFWAKRHEAFEVGELQMRRIVALKSSAAK